VVSWGRRGREESAHLYEKGEKKEKRPSISVVWKGKDGAWLHNFEKKPTNKKGKKKGEPSTSSTTPERKREGKRKRKYLE